MEVYKINQIKQIAQKIKNGYIVMFPTDTIYAMWADAFNKNAVEKVYNLRGRDKNKPCVIFVNKINDFKKFGIKINARLNKFLNSIFPNSISVVLPCNDKKFDYLHRGKKSLALRVPKKGVAMKLLKLIGQSIVPSVNIQGKKPAIDIKEAMKYFGEEIIYTDSGKIKGKTSTIISVKPNFDIKVLRKGAASGNKYFLMRHGEAVGNVKKIISSKYPEKWKNHLTEKGKEQIRENIKKLKNQKINLIVASPFLRTRQTAQIIKKQSIVCYNYICNYNTRLKIVYDERLKEINCGIYDNKNIKHYDNFVKSHIERYEKMSKNGESLRDVKIRMLEVIFELEKKYQNKNILIISHGHPLWALYGAMQGYSEQETSAHPNWSFKLAEIRKTRFL